MTSQHIQKTLKDFDNLEIKLNVETKWEDRELYRAIGWKVIDLIKPQFKPFLSQALTEQHEADVQSFREKIEGKRQEVPKMKMNHVEASLYVYAKAYNKALDDLLASLDETEK